MRRGITQRATRELLDFIRGKVENIALRTTLIVGYPTETDEDFQELYGFVKDMKFHRLGVFTYSHEEGTSAYELGDPIPEEVKEERKRIIMELQQEISRDRNEQIVGTQVRILLDRHEGEMAVGRTQWDAPEIDQEVFVRGVGMTGTGKFVKARVVDAVEYDLYAEVV